MDPLHLHLFLNDVPLIGAVGSLLLLAWGLGRRSTDVTLAALSALVLVGLLAVVVFVTGSELTHSNAALVQRHRDAAIAALVGIEAAAAIALAALFAWRTTHRYPGFAAIAALLVGLAASVLLVRVAQLGGEITHAIAMR